MAKFKILLLPAIIFYLTLSGSAFATDNRLIFPEKISLCEPLRYGQGNQNDPDLLKHTVNWGRSSTLLCGPMCVANFLASTMTSSDILSSPVEVLEILLDDPIFSDLRRIYHYGSDVEDLAEMTKRIYSMINWTTKIKLLGYQSRTYVRKDVAPAAFRNIHPLTSGEGLILLIRYSPSKGGYKSPLLVDYTSGVGHYILVKNFIVLPDGRVTALISDPERGTYMAELIPFYNPAMGIQTYQIIRPMSLGVEVVSAAIQIKVSPN